MRAWLSHLLRRAADFLDPPYTHVFNPDQVAHKLELSDPPDWITGRHESPGEAMDTECVPWSRGGYL